jgi:hypothetical protein
MQPGSYLAGFTEGIGIEFRADYVNAINHVQCDVRRSMKHVEAVP